MAARSEPLGKKTPRAKSLRELHRKRHDVPALILASAALLAFGLSLPLVTVEKLFWENRYSVATGVFGLWEDGEHLLAAVVFFFSVVFPIAKLLLLLHLWFARLGADARDALLGWLEALGKWSMLDVFIVAILIVATKLGPVADVHPNSGVYFFTAAILASMLSTQLVRKLAARA